MLPKRFQQQPDQVPLGQITDLSLEAIAAIERYKLVPSSLLLELLGGNRRVAQRHLHKLFQHGYIKCFSLENFGRSKELIYYLDNAKALHELIHRRGVNEDSLDSMRLRTNRERPYIHFNDPEKRHEVLSRLNTLDHELAISRFHGMVELACRRSDGRIRLKQWLQGKPAHRSVEARKIIYNRRDDRWEEGEGREVLPWRPDAFFTLLLADPAGEELELGFAYEYQQTTGTALERLLRKYRSHFQFVIQNKPLEHFGVKRLRAVLTESPDRKRADYLRKLIRDPIVSKNPSPLFLFTSSEFFTSVDTIQTGEQEGEVQQVPRFLHKPETVLERIWASPVKNTTLVNLVDH